ncbi:MAG: MarR family transcriptional regulator [Balneolales bacterium]
MSLENEIKQTEFRNVYNRGIVNLIYTYNHVLAQLQGILHPRNLTLQQYNILNILKGHHPQSATNGLIRDRMLDKNSDVTRIVDRLIKEGLAKREHCSNDRRCVNIYITPKGLSLIEKMDVLSRDMDGILNKLSNQEAAELNRLLDKIRE